MWTRYFECMIDDDQLQIDLAMGRKVPCDLFNVLVFCDSCDYAIVEQTVWKPEECTATRCMIVILVTARTMTVVRPLIQRLTLAT